MYKRKFPKTKNVDENSSSSSQLQKTTSSLNCITPIKAIISNKTVSDNDDSPESPSVLDDFSDFPIEKKRKTVDIYEDDTTDGSEPLFCDDDAYSYLKQTLISCGLHLKPDQNILCKTDTTFCIFIIYCNSI